MTIKFIDLRAQYLSIKEEIDEAVHRVLDSGFYLQGDELGAFEEEFAAYCGVRFGAGVNSGTTAIQLALTACGVGDGDKVATVANISAPTVAAIHSAGAKTILVDVAQDTNNMDPVHLRKVLIEHSGEQRIKAVIPVHLYGFPADIEKISRLCSDFDAVLIEDACQAHGAEYMGKRVGGFGCAGCFSFYPTKNLGAYGDSGMVVSNDHSLIERIKTLRCYGEKSKYFNTLHGINGRMEEIHAAVLRVKLRYLDRWNKKRQHLAGIYSGNLDGSGLQLPPVSRDDFRGVYHLYAIKSVRRDELQKKLAGKEIETSIHYPRPIHHQPAFRHLQYREGDLPHSESCCREVLSLPLYPELTEEKVEYVCNSILECL